MSNFKFGSTNLEDQFQLKSYYNGGFRGSDCGFKINGSDARNRYSIIKSYSPNNLKYSSNTGFKINGTDLKDIFAKKNEVMPYRSFQVTVLSSAGGRAYFQDATHGYDNRGEGSWVRFNCDLQVGKNLEFFSVWGGSGGYADGNHGYHWDTGAGGNALALFYNGVLICICGAGGGGGTNHHDSGTYGGNGGKLGSHSNTTNGAAGNGNSTAGHGGGGTHNGGGGGGDCYNCGGGSYAGTSGSAWWANSTGNYSGNRYYRRNYSVYGHYGKAGDSYGGTSAASGGGGGAGYHSGGGGGGVAWNGANAGGGSGGGGSSYYRRGDSNYGNIQFVQSGHTTETIAYVQLKSNTHTWKTKRWDFGTVGVYTIPDPYYSNL
tara:strand:+ start:955 stop:2079 length:1125 start_codon:yes stop_codon:yes gene_type:complete